MATSHVCPELSSKLQHKMGSEDFKRQSNPKTKPSNVPKTRFREETECSGLGTGSDQEQKA
jgi:hypothetical protein